MNSKIIKQRDYKAPNFVLQAVNLDFLLNNNNTYVKNRMKFTNIIGDICLDVHSYNICFELFHLLQRKYVRLFRR